MIRVKTTTQFLSVTRDKSKNIIIQNDRFIARLIINTKRVSTNVSFITTLRKLHCEEFNFNNIKKLKRFRSKDKFF